MGSVLGVVGVERPQYEVLAEKDTYEIRKYTAPRVEAVVSSEDLLPELSGKEFETQAFRALAKYIGVYGKYLRVCTLFKT